MIMAEKPTETRRIVSRAEWLTARMRLLEREKELTRQRDEVSRQRRELPWVKVEENYVFDGPHGKVTLAELFDCRSQLIVYHFMFGPEWKEGCPSCSFMSDQVDGALPHLAARGVSYVTVSRAPLAQIQAFQARMGWRFKWVSSDESDFNYDFHVSATPAERAKARVHYNYSEMDFSGDELPGMSAFFRDPDGSIFHTYSCFARGLDLLIGTYNWLDLAPMGRNEEGLPWPMAWVRHHDKYETHPAKERCHG
jgi:predicted dithiol-disulfide oxidoreductase (DUF899 family)